MEQPEHEESSAGDLPAAAWDVWRHQLPKRLQARVDSSLRRALKRRLQRLETLERDAVPDSVRSQAVMTWRKRYMPGASKSARKRKNYARLKNEPSYRAIERELMGDYWEERLPDGLVDSQDVGRLSFADVCEVYQLLGPAQGSVPLEDVLREVVQRVCADGVIVVDVREEMAREVLQTVRVERLPALRSTRQRTEDDTGHRHAHGREGAGELSLADAVDERDVTERVLRANYVERVVRLRYGQAPVYAATRSLVVARLARHHHVANLCKIICGLVGSDVATTLLERHVKREVHEVEGYLLSPGFAQLVAEGMLENPLYGRQFRRFVELRLRVRDRVPETPMEAYPLARTMRRRFVLHVGPTNSGKTHEALMVLAAAESGAYLGPLRLLAYEQFEELNRLGTPCSLLTGEESIELAGARHVSSTVEMAQFSRAIGVAVIDEAQMVADRDRGYHWTEALLGIPAREVHVCCAPHAEGVVRRLVDLCEDELEVVRHERLVPLEADRGEFRLPESVQAGDALVVFSRRSVHAVAALVTAAGLKASLVYGALPHDVRHEEARRFDEGETDVVVATDAIGMGMNLPIRRVVFVEQDKYDGRTTRPLLPEEVQQIAGRAGRFGRYDIGRYHSTRLRRDIERRYRQEVAPIETIPVGIPADIALVRDATLSECIRQWMTIEQPQPFERIQVTRDMALIAEVEGMLPEERRRDIATKQLVLALATMPFDERDRELHGTWRQMVACELEGKEALVDMPPGPSPDDRLIELEWRHRFCDLLYTYARTFRHPDRLEALSQRRDEISHAIMALLARG